jgi:dihydropteroate synthase
MADLRLSKRDAFLKAIETAPVVMGILNVTPDSFSDGGRHEEATAAVAGALQMEKEGAAIIDIGAESTRPGATPVSQAEELSRLESVLEPICNALTVAASIDTYKAAVARRAAMLGISVVNDIWGLQGDPDMAYVTADAGCALVAMHNREDTDGAIDIVDDMLRFFERTLRLARQAGIPEEFVVLDPGFGFGKTLEQNFAVLGQLERLTVFGRPILLGLSRKRMIGAALNTDVKDRLFGTLSANAIGLANGARVLRVHDVCPHADAIKIYNAMEATR